MIRIIPIFLSVFIAGCSPPLVTGDGEVCEAKYTYTHATVKSEVYVEKVYSSGAVLALTGGASISFITECSKLSNKTLDGSDSLD